MRNSISAASKIPPPALTPAKEVFATWCAEWEGDATGDLPVLGDKLLVPVIRNEGIDLTTSYTIFGQ